MNTILFDGTEYEILDTMKYKNNNYYVIKHDDKNVLLPIVFTYLNVGDIILTDKRIVKKVNSFCFKCYTYNTFVTKKGYNVNYSVHIIDHNGMYISVSTLDLAFRKELSRINYIKDILK